MKKKIDVQEKGIGRFPLIIKRKHLDNKEILVE